MNIFYTNIDPEKAAEELPLKLVIKMPTESAQLLLTQFPLKRLEEQGVPRRKNGLPYKHFNPKHPSALWIAESRDNYEWVLKHALKLCDIYNKLYGKVHFITHILNWIKDHIEELDFPSELPTPIKLAMPEEYKLDDPCLAYQNYIKDTKDYYAKWSSVEHIPYWWSAIGDLSIWVDKSFKEGVYTP